LSRPSKNRVQAAIRYLVPGAERPVYFASQGGADAALDIAAEFEDREVVIHDARRLRPPASLDRQGFTLVAHPTAIRDFYALQSDRETYESEISELVLTASGGTDALVFDHTLRSDSRNIRGARRSREAASVIHNDYTDASAAKRLRELLPRAEAERKEAARQVADSVLAQIENNVSVSIFKRTGVKNANPS